MNVIEIKRAIRSFQTKAMGYIRPYRGFGPMPQGAKISALKRIFVPGVVIETGTYLGNTTLALAKEGYEVHTIEVSENLASQIFPGLRKKGIHCYNGDSGILIEQVIEKAFSQNKHNLNFWLDGHWSHGITSKAADYETPILQELKIIARFRDKCQKLVVAVDDVRCFGNDPAYPPKRFLTEWADTNHLHGYFLADIFVATTEIYSDI